MASIAKLKLYICDMKHEIVIKNTADLERAATEFLEKIGNNKLVALFAPMGSGKTTFTTAVCKVLGVTDPVGSPTFAIVNEYMTAAGDPMFHFDFYRINKFSEAVEIGLYDYLDSQSYYTAPVKKECRSMMNVTFVTGNADLDKKFASEASAAGLKNLKGHRSVGGMRASIYNAMPTEGVEKLIAFMKDFAEKNPK